MNSGGDMNDTAATDVSLEEAIRILELTDFPNLTLEELAGLRKRAMRRWHPDRIAHAKPAPELVAEYETNFVRVEPAIELLQRLLDGEEDIAPRREANKEREPAPEEAVRKYAEANQERLHRAWADVKGKPEFYTEEEVVLAEGISVAEALKADLDDKLPSTAVFSFAAGQAFLVVAILGLLIPGMILAVLGLDSLIELIVGIGLVIWATHALSCLLVLAPLSRLWVPPAIMQFAAKLVYWPIQWAEEWEEGFLSIVIQLVLHAVSLIVQNLIVRPIYWIAGEIWSGKRLFRAVTELRYYHGLSEAYVDRLAEKDTTLMDLDELFDLSHAASRLGSN